MALSVGERIVISYRGVNYEIEAAEDGGYVVSVPAYSGANSEGGTLEEALENGEDALHTCLAAAKQLGLEIPSELAHLAE